jgi:hypothetical protein
MPTKPSDHAVDCIKRARALHALSASGQFQLTIADDLLRLSLVMGVAALDTLMHQLVWRAVTTHDELPKNLAQYEVPFSRLWDLAHQMKSTARAAGKRARPLVSVKTTLREHLAGQTFQSYRRVGDAMAMAGINKGWSATATELGIKAEKIEETLTEIVAHRNRIVHEGHHERQDRPRAVKLAPVTATEIKKQLDWLEKLVVGIAKVAGA